MVHRGVHSPRHTVSCVSHPGAKKCPVDLRPPHGHKLLCFPHGHTKFFARARIALMQYYQLARVVSFKIDRTLEKGQWILPK